MYERFEKDKREEHRYHGAILWKNYYKSDRPRQIKEITTTSTTTTSGSLALAFQAYIIIIVWMWNGRVDAIKFYDTLPHILLLSAGYPGGIKGVDVASDIKAVSACPVSI